MRKSARQVLISLADSSEIDAVEPPVAAVFDLPDFELDGELIRMRAVDDLAGCGATLAVLERLLNGEQRPAGDVYGFFTRAEGSGAGGGPGWLPRPANCRVKH